VGRRAAARIATAARRRRRGRSERAGFVEEEGFFLVGVFIFLFRSRSQKRGPKEVKRERRGADRSKKEQKRVGDSK